MVKKQVETFLQEKRGYIKKSPINVAKRMWKLSPKHVLPKNKKELEKELEVIKEVQSAMRKALNVEETQFQSELMNIYNEIIEEKNRKPVVLYFDIETSPNIAFTWRVGNKISLTHDNLVHERAIITICWKFSNEDKVHSLQWNKGDDKELVQKFAEIFNKAEVLCGHNSDKFDIRFLRTRALKHGVWINPKPNTIDTLKLARNNFGFNSNRLDYISKFLGKHGKNETTYSLWKDIVLYEDKEAMKAMVEYCKNDVKILQEVHEMIEEFVPKKKFKLNLK